MIRREARHDHCRGRCHYGFHDLHLHAFHRDRLRVHHQEVYLRYLQYYPAKVQALAYSQV